jgi:hypothetical protein
MVESGANGILAVDSGDDIEPFSSEASREHFAGEIVIIDDEDRLSRHEPS